MLAVSATETPNRKNALHWLLLTTEGLDSGGAESRSEAGAVGVGNLVETAKTAIRWYVLRWTIELFFKALKTGIRIEDRQLDHTDDLRKCLVFDAITACDVFDLERMARDKPDTPADEVVTQEEIDVLSALLKAQGGPRARALPGHRPDIRTFVIDLAGTVGFHPRRQQPLPGSQKVWQGYVRLKLATLTYQAMKGTDLICIHIHKWGVARSGTRHIQGGRAAPRTAVYMAATSAATWNPDMQAFYQCLRGEGKEHKVAIVAVIRKLIVLANVLLNQDRHWLPMAPTAAGGSNMSITC